MAIKDLLPIQKHLFLCNGGTCKLKGAEESSAIIRQKIIDAGLSSEMHTTKTLCNGRCKDGPVVIAMPEGVWFKEILPDAAADFALTYLQHEQVPEKHLLYRYGSDMIFPVQKEAVAEDQPQ